MSVSRWWRSSKRLQNNSTRIGRRKKVAGGGSRVGLETLEERRVLAVGAGLSGMSSEILTVSLDDASDQVFLQVDSSGDIDVGTTAGGSEVHAGYSGVTSINIEDTGSNADQQVTFSTGMGVFAQNVTLTGIETADLEQDITGTVSGDASVANVTLSGSIQDGVDAVGSGGTVNVGDGTYNENVLIGQPLTLLSVNGRATTTIEGVSGAGALGAVQVTPGVDGVQIGDTGQGFTIIGIDNGAPAIENAAIYFQGDHDGAVIRDNEIQANGDSGLTTEYGATINDFTIDGNEFSGQTFLGANPAGYGFGSQTTLANVPRQLVVMGNGGNTMNPATTTNITFTNNEITGTAGGTNTSSQEQGNTLVTIDAANSNISNNTFAGTTTRYGSALRVRRPDTDIIGNTFDTSNMSDSTSVLYLENNTDPIEDIVAANTIVGGGALIEGTGDTVFQTIQAAIFFATPGDTVQVLAGTYAEDVNVNVDNLTLTGQGVSGTNLTRVEGIEGGSSTATFDINASGVTLENFYITRQGNDVSTWDDVTLNSAGVAIQNQSVDATIQNNVIYGNRTAIDVNNSNDNTIRNNEISMNHTGLIFRNQTDNTVLTENLITNNRTVGVLFLEASGMPEQSAINSSFTGNNISGNWYGQIVDRQPGTLSGGGDNLKNFSGNWLGSTTPTITTDPSAEPGYSDLIPPEFGGSATNPGGEPEIAGAGSANFDITPLLTSDTDTDSGTFGFQGDFSDLLVTTAGAQDDTAGRIQEAVEVAEAGGTVNLPVGTFTETGQIVVDSDLTLSGADQATTIIQAGFDTPAGGDAGALFLVEDNISLDVDNLTIDGNGFSVYEAIRYLGNGSIDSVTFNDIQFGTYAGVAIAVRGIDADVDVSNSTFTNIGRIGVLYKGADVTGDFTGNTYTGKGMGDHIDYALDISAGADINVIDNYISNNQGVAASDGSTSAGILVTTYFGPGTTATVEGNVFTGNSGGVAVGYAADDTSTVSVSNNDLSGNLDYAIVSSNPTVSSSANWFGTTDIDQIIEQTIGDIEIDSILTSGDDDGDPTNGFQTPAIPNQIATLIAPQDAAANDLELRLNGSDLELVTDGTVTGTLPLSSLSGIVVQGANEANVGDNDEGDTLTIDYAAGGVINLPITFAGGSGGSDALVIEGGSFTTATYNYDNANDGNIDLDGNTITYTGLEPIANTGTATNMVFNLPATDNTATLTNSGSDLLLDSVNGTFEDTTIDPSGVSSITINAGDGDDSITVTPQAGIVLNVDGGMGSDSLSYTGTGTVSVTGSGTGTIAGTGVSDVDFSQLELLEGSSLTFDVQSTANTSDTPTATDNDYTRISNAIDLAGSDTTVLLAGTFDWIEANAAASWELGNDGTSGTDDDYSVMLPSGRTDVTITANTLGDATIQGPGDVPTVDLEGVFLSEFGSSSGKYHGLEISNLEIFDFDLSIGLFEGGGGIDKFNDASLLNNHILMATDLHEAGGAESVQNIGIHIAFGDNQTIQGNLIQIPGDGVSDSANDMLASSVALQGNTSGSAYDGLVIDNNRVEVLNAQSADPEKVLGIWENGHAHNSDIVVSNNVFTNLSSGNDPTANRQTAFRITSHSSAATTVEYNGNQVEGASLGFEWLEGGNLTHEPVVLTGNTLTNVSVGFRVEEGLGSFSDNTITNTGPMAGVGTGIETVGDSVITLDDTAGVNTFTGLATGVNLTAASTLTGNGAVTGSVAVGDNATVTPAPGQQTLGTGSLAVTGGSFEFEIEGPTAGPGAGSHDQLTAMGTVDLGAGTATLDLSGGYTPQMGDDFVLIANDGTDPTLGMFDGMADGAEVTFGGETLFLTYNGGDGNDVVLNTDPILAGTPGDDTIIVTPQANGDLVYELNGNSPVTITDPTDFEFNGLGGNDTMTVIANGENLPSGGITFNGNNPTSNPGDVLQVQGSGQDVTYTPDASTPGNGLVELDGQGTISFTGLEPVDMTGFGTVTLSLPGDHDAVDIAEGFDAASGTEAALVLSGTSGGVAFEALHAWNNDTVVVDTTTVDDGNDHVTISGAANAHGNTNLSIDTGTGIDDVVVDGNATFAGEVFVTSAVIDVNAELNVDTASLTAFGPLDVGAAGDLAATNNVIFQADSVTVAAGGFVGSDFGDLDFYASNGSITNHGTTNTGADGDIFLDASDSIMLTNTNSAGGTFVSTAGNETVISGSVSGSEMVSLTTTSGLIDASGMVSSSSDNVTLDSGDSVTIGSSVSALGGLVAIFANTTVEVTAAGSIDSLLNTNVNSGGSQTIDGNIDSTDGIKLDSGGALTISGALNAVNLINVDSVGDTAVNGGSIFTSSDSVDIVAGGDFSLNSSGSIDTTGASSTTTIASGGDLIVESDTAVSGFMAVVLSGGQAGNGSFINLAGRITSDLITINGGDGDDDIVVDGNGGTGGDGGTVENLIVTGAPNDIVVNGGMGTDSIVLDDSGSTTADVITIDGSVVGLHETVTIDYNDMESVEVYAGEFDDIFNVQLSPSTAFTVHGNDPEAPLPMGFNGDTLNIETSDNMLGNGGPFVFASTPDGNFTDNPDQTITWTSIENFTIDGDAFVAGDLYVTTGDNSDRIIFYSTNGVDTEVRIGNTNYGPYSLLAGSRMVVYSNDGNDTIIAEGFLVPFAEFHSGIGNDYIQGGHRSDFLYGGLGNDRILGGEGDNFIHGDDPSDPSHGGSDRLIGRSGDDILIGGFGTDRLIANEGDDTLDGGQGNDQIFGGLGDDFSFGGGSGSGGQDNGFDLIRDSQGDDVILGGSGNDILFGDRDRDLVIAGLGADRISGGSGDDEIVNGSSDLENAIDLALADLAMGDDSSFTSDVLPALNDWWDNYSSAGFDNLVDDDDNNPMTTDDIDDMTGGSGTDIFNAGSEDILRDFRASESDSTE